jgi:hypothetical protein
MSRGASHLRPALQHGAGSQQADQGLSRAHVALQQDMGLVSAGKARLQDVHRGRLAFVESEGEFGFHRRSKPFGGRKPSSASGQIPTPLAQAHQHREPLCGLLVQEQRLRLGDALGPVDAQDPLPTR